MNTAGLLLTAKNLVRHFHVRSGVQFGKFRTIRAVDGVTFDMKHAETLALVGESGCGKTTTGHLIAGIDRPTSGSVEFTGQLNARSCQIVFQNPAASLDPRMSIGRQIREPLDIHRIGTPARREDKVHEMMDAVGLSQDLLHRFPHELSGGQLQRAVIARALVLEPRLLVADEPVSALDVSVQAQVVNLLADLQHRYGLSLLVISHDLKVVRNLSHRIAIMYLGKIVEIGDAEAILSNPLHPYSQALVSAVPVPDPTRRRERIILRGEPPSPADPPSGCGFHPRCPRSEQRCQELIPQLRELADGRRVACHLSPGG